LITDPKNHGREINDEKSWRTNRWKRNHRGGIVEERSMWEASGRHLGGIRDASGRHLGGTLDSRRPWGSRRLRITKIDALSARMQKFH
jgi:hypothetical protein